MPDCKVLYLYFMNTNNKLIVNILLIHMYEYGLLLVCFLFMLMNVDCNNRQSFVSLLHEYE